MQRVSSNLTLFLRIVLPTMWLVFFGAFTFVTIFLKNEEIPIFQTLYFKLGTLTFFLIGMIFLLLTVFRIKRVDMGEDNFYVTNYFKTYRYTYNSIADLSESNYLIFKTIRLKLKEKGAFGTSIRFIQSRTLWDQFFKQHPHLLKDIFENDTP